MADILIPPWVRISGGKYDFVSNTAAASSIFTGATRTLARAGDRVRVGFSTANASDRETDPTRALLKAIRAASRGQTARIWYTDPGYRRRGSFPTSELLTNNTFASGTTGWTAAAGGVLSAADRMLRVSNSGTQGHQGRQTVILTQYAPHVARALIQPGRNTILPVLYLDDSVRSATHSNSPYMSFACIESALSTVGLFAALENSGALAIAGDYFSLPYTSVSRCALVDNGLNALLQSDALNNVAWTLSNATATANTGAAPDGTTTADSFTENTANSEHRALQQGTRANAAADCCVYGYFKRGSGNRHIVLRIDGSDSNGAIGGFDLANGIATAPATLGTGTNPRSFIVNAGNGWYFCALIARCAATTAIRGLYNISNSTASSVPSYTGDGTSLLLTWMLGTAVTSMPTRGAHTTSATSSGTTQTGSSLYIKGLPPSTNGLLLFGDWVQIGLQLAMVVAPLNSDAAGLGYLQLAYPLRSAPADNDPIIIHEPMGRFVLTGNEGGWTDSPGVVSNFEFEMIEALDT